jgi:hypothetical protein
MKIKKLILFSIFLFVVNACSNKANKSFNQLSVEINRNEISSLSLSSIEKLVDKIDNHINNFPDFEKNFILLNFKREALIAAEEKYYEDLVSAISQLELEDFQDYESAITQYSNLRQKFSDFIVSSKNQQKISDAKSRIEKLNKKIYDINIEKNAFYAASNSNSIFNIEEFISQYPNSFMLNVLISKIDELYYSNFLSELNNNPSSIYEINNNISLANNYRSKLRGLDSKNKINEIISSNESERRSVLEIELDNKLQVLIERMESAARIKAENTRPTYIVETATARNSLPEIVGYSANIERSYQVNMRGAFFGIDKRELVIIVTGRISGDLQNGASISITGIRIASDIKL